MWRSHELQRLRATVDQVKTILDDTGAADRANGDRPAGRPRGSGMVDLVVIVNGFPRLSETFVLAELLDLERRGVRLHLVALSRPEEAVEQAGLGRLHATVEHLPPVTGPGTRVRVWAAHATLLGRDAGRYLKGISTVIRSPDYSRRRLDQAAVLAARLVDLGAPAMYVHFAHKPGTVARFASLLAGIPYAMSAHAKDIWLTPPTELALKVRGA